MKLIRSRSVSFFGLSCELFCAELVIGHVSEAVMHPVTVHGLVSDCSNPQKRNHRKAVSGALS